MNWKLKGISAACASMCFILLASTNLFPQVEFHGFVRNHSAFRIAGPNDAMILRNRFRLNSEILGDNVYGFASVDILNDVVDAEKSIISLREAYLDIYSSFVDFRIGKQQVVWGKADGYFINDIVNPLDLSYFLLQDFEDIRMATTMLNTKFHYGNHSLEALMIPEFKPIKMNFEGDWGFQRPDYATIPDLFIPHPFFPDSFIFVPSQDVVIDYQDDIIFRNSLRKAEYGFKLNTFLLSTDLSLIFLKIREDKPVFYKEIVLDVYYQPIGLNLTPSHPWVTFYGANFARPFKAFVFRGEGGYYPKRFFNSEDMEYVDDGMLVKKGFVQCMLAMDYQLTGNIDIGVQSIHERILDYESGIVEDEINSIGSILLRGRFFNESVQPMLLTLYNIDNKSSITRLMMDWNFSDSFKITSGVDILEGDSDTIFGQFDGNDNVYLKVKYSF